MLAPKFQRTNKWAKIFDNSQLHEQEIFDQTLFLSLPHQAQHHSPLRLFFSEPSVTIYLDDSKEPPS